MFTRITNLTNISFWVTKMYKNKGLFSYWLCKSLYFCKVSFKAKGGTFFSFLISDLVLIHSLVTAGFALPALHAGLLWGILIKGFLKSYSNVSRVLASEEPSRKPVNCLWLLTMCALRKQRKFCLEQCLQPCQPPKEFHLILKAESKLIYWKSSFSHLKLENLKTECPLPYIVIFPCLFFFFLFWLEFGGEAIITIINFDLNVSVTYRISS